MSRAIDRATRWEYLLEANGHTVTRAYSEGNSGREIQYETTVGYETMRWIIYLDTPRTKFCVGQRIYFGTSQVTNSPGQMSRWIFSAIETANWKREQAATA